MNEMYLFYAFIGFAAAFLAEAAYLLTVNAGAGRRQVNRRLKISAPDANRQEVMVTLRRERGLTAAGGMPRHLAWLGRLIVQCGITIGLTKLMLLFAATGLIIAGLVFASLWSAHTKRRTGSIKGDASGKSGALAVAPGNEGRGLAAPDGGDAQ